MVSASLKNLRRLVDQGFKDDVICRGSDGPRVVVSNANIADEMFDIARSEHFGMGDRVGAIFEHSHSVAGHQRQRQAGVRIVTGNKPIDVILREEIRPTFDLATIQNRGIFKMKLFDQPP